MDQSLLEYSKTAGISYVDYKEKVLQWAAEGKTSGELTEAHIVATKLNAQRMKRIDKQCKLTTALLDNLQQLKGKFTWLILTEAWCGDGAQIIPVVAKIAEAHPSIEVKLIFRDEHLDLMSHFLTNGTMGIPKLICINELTKQVIGTWGPRPKAIVAKIIEYKKQNPAVDKDTFNANLHLWYAHDNTMAVQEDFTDLLLEWKNKIEQKEGAVIS